MKEPTSEGSIKVLDELMVRPKDEKVKELGGFTPMAKVVMVLDASG